jgi:hypothetical protein
MESREIHCQRCNKNTQHTFRYHITKTKHYSVVSVGSGKKEITVVCHVCLLETSIDKNDSKELVKQYDNEIATGEANELMDKGKDSKAENKLRKVLKKDPEFPQALYSISKCLISQAKYGEAEFYIKILENKFPDIPEIKELRDSLPPKLVTNEPKKEIISRAKDSDVQEVTTVLNDKTNEDDSDDRNSNTQSEKMDETEVAEYLELIEKLQKEGLGNSNILIEVKQILVKDRGLDENNLQYLTELDIQLDNVGKSEKDREERQKELDDLKEMKGEEKLEESKRQVEKTERELEEKKKRKEESRNKMNGDEKLEESKRRVEEAEKELEEKKKRKEESRNKMGREKKLEESKRHAEKAEKELEEKKKRKEESRNNREMDKQIAINEEKIRKIEEESKKLDEEVDL